MSMSSGSNSRTSGIQLQEINFVEKGVDGSTKERILNSQSRALDINDFRSKKIEEGSENWNKLGKRTQDFYSAQNQEIDAFDEVETLMGNPGSQEQLHANQLSLQKVENFLIWLSFGVNCALLAALIIAFAFSGAIAIIASVMDSALDLLSTIIILVTMRAKNRVNRYKYPQGKERLEPVGVLVFSAVMGTSSLLLIVESAKKLIYNTFDAPDVGYITIGFVCGDILVKIILFFICFRYRKQLLNAKALAQDHRNDVVVNSVALIAAYLGSAYWAPIDPIGAILISFWTMYNWGDSCIEQVKLLTGRSASPEFLKRLTWVCFNHDASIIAIDTVRAFHFGTRFLVEIDIVLPPETSLQNSHDIGEALQKKVELLEEVERAFVHIDFETSHHPDSEHKKWGAS